MKVWTPRRLVKNTVLPQMPQPPDTRPEIRTENVISVLRMEIAFSIKFTPSVWI